MANIEKGLAVSADGWMKYWINMAESLSQVLNTIHAGEPNETFSARVAGKRDTLVDEWGYWRFWVWSFETFWPGHLDWAAGLDEG